jgi:hypothetical protein
MAIPATLSRSEDLTRGARCSTFVLMEVETLSVAGSLGCSGPRRSADGRNDLLRGSRVHEVRGGRRHRFVRPKRGTQFGSSYPYGGLTGEGGGALRSHCVLADGLPRSGVFEDAAILRIIGEVDIGLLSD